MVFNLTFDETKQAMVPMRSVTVEQGDGKYMGIAAASILAKTARDANIHELCDQYPLLDDLYGFRKNSILQKLGRIFDNYRDYFKSF